MVWHRLFMLFGVEMPLGKYRDFEHCVRSVGQKPGVDDPKAYCGAIKKKVEGFVMASSNPFTRKAKTVKEFIRALVSELTSMDEQNSKKPRGFNPYALPQYLGAAQELGRDLKSIENNDNPKSLQTLLDSMPDYFLLRDRSTDPTKFGLSAVSRVAAEIRKRINSGGKVGIAMKTRQMAARVAQRKQASKLKPGQKVKVPHRGKTVPGTIVRWDDGGSGGSRQHGGGYVVDVGEDASIMVPEHNVRKASLRHGGRDKDPHGIVGFEVQAADGGDYGYRVTSYDEVSGDYIAFPIQWSTGRIRGRATDIDAFKMSYRYDIKSKRSPKKSSLMRSAGGSFDGVKVRAIGVFAKGLKDGEVYTLRKASKFNGVDTYNFIDRRNKSVARFDEDDIERFLRNGDGHNGLVRIGAAGSPKTVKGVFYFKSEKEAKAWAEDNGWPTDRIVQYDRGYAIQSGKSGNYAGPGVTPKKFGSRRVAGVLDTIRPGDRVTINISHGTRREPQERTGKAVMRGPAGWVLNLGGRHGTPGIATEENIVAIKGKRV